MPDKLGVFIQPRLDLPHLKHHYLWLPGKKEMFGLSASASRDSPRPLRRPARIAVADASDDVQPTCFAEKR